MRKKIIPHKEKLMRNVKRIEIQKKLYFFNFLWNRFQNDVIISASHIKKEANSYESKVI